MNSTKNFNGMKTLDSLIIAVDGYSSCGKSTFARLIARELNFVYIDSGAMYRAVAIYGLKHDLVHEKGNDQSKLKQSLRQIHIEFKLNPLSGIQETWLNGQNVEEEIRGLEVSKVASKISQIKEVREKLVSLQRSFGNNGNVVMDGRDIGSVVFPDATLKIFMTADTDVRAMRRYKELTEKGIAATLEEVKNNIRTRDHEDENRKESPLLKAADAIVLDNSNMTVDQQMEWFREKWQMIIHAHEH
jgi:cytidylate kinase